MHLAIQADCGEGRGLHWEDGVRKAEAELRLAERSP